MSDATTISIGISGKRNIAPEEKARVYAEIKARITALLKHHKCQAFIGFSSLAKGADTIFAEVVVKEFGQPLHVVLPFPREEYEKDFDGEDLGVFGTWIDQAATIETTSAMPTTRYDRNDAYFEAGRTIADRCDEMLFVWDEIRPNGVGGTAEILAYWAEKKQEFPVSHIKVRPMKADALHEELIHTYHKANLLAIKARAQYRQVWKWAILLGWMTVLFFATKTAFRLEGGWGRLLTLLEFLCVAAVYTLILTARKRNYHGRYLRERMKAETCRLMRSFYHAGVPIGIADKGRETDSILVDLATRINQRLDSDGRPSRWYTQYVIRSLVKEQCNYHVGKVKTIGDAPDRYERANNLIGILFIVNLAIHLILDFSVRDGEQSIWPKLSIFFNLLLPASYAALEGITYFNEWAVLKQYSASAEYGLKETGALLPADLTRTAADECFNTQSRVLHLVSGIMLSDNKNWNLLLENRGNYHLIV